MDLIAFVMAFFAGFFSCLGMFLSLIYWDEIKDMLYNLRDRVHVRWILWKHR
jgi:hypothetical protein